MHMRGQQCDSGQVPERLSPPSERLHVAASSWRRLGNREAGQVRLGAKRLSGTKGRPLGGYTFLFRAEDMSATLGCRVDYIFERHHPATRINPAKGIVAICCTCRTWPAADHGDYPENKPGTTLINTKMDLSVPDEDWRAIFGPRQ